MANYPILAAEYEQRLQEMFQQKPKNIRLNSDRPKQLLTRSPFLQRNIDSSEGATRERS